MRRVLLSGQAPSGFTPTALGTKLSAWWHADDLANAAVSTWTDRIASIAAAQATGGNQPIKAATSFNAAYGGVTFDGTDDYLEVGATTGLPTGGTAGEIWLLGAGPGADGTARDVFAYGGTSNGTFRRITKGSGDLAAISDGTTTINGSSWLTEAIIAAIFEPTVYTHRRDGTDLVPDTTATLATGTTRIRIGATSATVAARFWKGVVRHVIVTTILTSQERLKMDGWLAWDSGLTALLPSGHPYKNIRP